MSNDNKSKYIPLADKMRPRNLEEFLGQSDIIADGKILRRAIENDSLPSVILWGPPGSGKTTLANIIKNATKSEFVKMSAVTSGVKDLKAVISKSKENKLFEKQTILFVDEIHRWNKSQQDALLPHIENGTIILIGATTENPSFEVRSALLSRTRVFVLNKLSEDEIKVILKNALSDKKRGLGNIELEINDEVLDNLAGMANGDARSALNALEYASQNLETPFNNLPAREEGGDKGGSKGEKGDVRKIITVDSIKEAYQKSHLLYDKDGEEHYNIISALHKAMRGSDPDASIYWLARMLEAGEDPLYIARRVVRFASEDIGLANSLALPQAVAAYQACHFIGMPECNVILAQAVVYMAKCKKSNNLYTAYKKAARDVQELGNQEVPLHIRNAPTKLMKNLGYGKGYKYSPDYDYSENQEYLPEKLKGKKYL